jgi:acetyl-CoA carboxylase biotin carboxyl carrier protein
MSYRSPRALHTGYDDHGDPEVIELHHGLDDVLASVRQAATELLAASPLPPSTLTVRAGAVSVEMAWTAAPAPATAPAAAAGESATVAPPAAEVSSAANILVASTVGVFYRAPSPGAAPFVKEGDQVVPGQQVGIIEAMKLMLPVESDRPGRVVEVLVKDGESVEFGRPLFRLAPIES